MVNEDIVAPNKMILITKELVTGAIMKLKYLFQNGLRKNIQRRFRSCTPKKKDIERNSKVSEGFRVCR